MKLLNYFLLIAISFCFIACGGDEVDSISQDFKLKSNLEYGNAVKIGEEIKVGIVVDSIDTSFEGRFITSINTNDPNNCTVISNDRILTSSDHLDHNYKTSSVLWVQFKAKEAGNYILTVTVSNGVIAAKTIEIEIFVSEYTYNIALSCDASEGTVLGAGQYTKGNTVSVAAEPKDGYSFVGWYSQGYNLTSNNPYIFPASEDRNLEARFEKSMFNVEAEIEGEGSVVGMNSYPKGSNVTLDAMERERWQFVGYYDMNGILLSTEKRYIINNLNKNIKLKVKFIASVYAKFYLNFEGSLYYTPCSDDKRVVTDYTNLTVKTFTYKNGQPQPYIFSTESLVVNFDYGIQGTWYAWQSGERKWMCSYDVPREMNGTSLTIYQVSEKTHKHTPIAQYGMAHINYLRNVKLSKSVTADNRNIHLDPVVDIIKEGKKTYYPIP
ncbi:MAG: InlB B-repeat-containing protein [Prevotella sp.]|jgi:hypothetical protein|nr:InlB B-repeat-containing protein [Prevotella sp.]